MPFQKEKAFITNGRIILSGNIRGMVRDEGCCNGLSNIDLYRVYVGCGARPPSDYITPTEKTRLVTLE